MVHALCDVNGIADIHELLMSIPESKVCTTLNAINEIITYRSQPLIIYNGQTYKEGLRYDDKLV